MFTESAMMRQSNNFGFTTTGHSNVWVWGSDSGNPSGVKVNNPQTGIQYGQTTLDKLLGTLLSGIALFKNQPYVPTTQQPQQQQYYPQQLTPEQLAALYSQQQGSVAAQAAFDLETFIKNNTGLLLIGGLGVVLFMSGRK